MTPQRILQHLDTGQLWPHAPGQSTGLDVPAAYQQALAVRALRVARGERPCGFKIGFTNRNIWPRYDVFAPIWGTVYDSTLTLCEGQASLSLAGTCQPRIEPEAVFGMRATPAADASPDQLFDAIDWVAPGFEIVQSHLPNWKFQAPDTIADGALHARLLVGQRVPVRELATNASQLHALLAGATVTLSRGGAAVEHGCGANVLDGPLAALRHFLQELRGIPTAPELMPGDVVTTGTWTDAWPVQAGEQWAAEFTAPLSRLVVEFR